MIQEELAKQILKNLSSLKLSPPAVNNNYRFKDTLKQCLLDSVGDSTITLEATNKLKIEIKKEEFNLALFSDFYFGHIRIKEQIKNVGNLLNSSSQVAWIVTTTYYACYFMAVEIAKLHGEFIINFSADEFATILSNSSNPNGLSVTSDSNNSFKVLVKSSNYENFLDLQLTKESSKPHKIVWINLCKIIRQLKVHDCLLQHKNLLTDICDNGKDKWKLPSTVRNEWNYTYANYYSDNGTDLGNKFLSIIKNPNSAMKWTNLRTIQPDEQNITASIAYLYHCLCQTIEKLDNRFNPS